MPPRIPLRPLRCIRPPVVRRAYSTAVPQSVRSIRAPLLFGSVVLGTGLYYLSKSSYAEVQSSKTQPQNENRELSASASRKAAEKPGKAEKEAHKSGGSSHDNKPESAVGAKKPESGADEDSQTGKFKGGHDEQGKPKDERLKGKAGKAEDKKDEKKEEKKDDKKSEKKDEKKDDKKDKENEDSQDDDEEQQGQQAFNPETGEINWDCPCLGDMPHGPCGPQFRKAFSCFVHSDAEPKGQDCIDAFGEMQDCFRAHPDVYKPMDALDDDDLDDNSEEALETATKKGDEKLDHEGKDEKKEEKKDGKKVKKGEETSEDKSQGKQEAQKHEKIAKKSTSSRPLDDGGKKPKQGDERKNENTVARSG